MYVDYRDLTNEHNPNKEIITDHNWSLKEFHFSIDHVTSFTNRVTLYVPGYYPAGKPLH